MATPDQAALAMATMAEDFIDRYGEDIFLAAIRPFLIPHLTPEAMKRANDAADLLERQKFGGRETG